MNTLVSVIITNYNYEQYIAEAIESVINQTYQNFELIVVDDGSIDQSAVILKKYEALYPDKIKVIFKENGGQGSAFNAGFEVAGGEIIAFLDADDYWYGNKLEIIVKYHQKHDGIQHNLLINNKKKFTYLDHLSTKQHKALLEFGFLGLVPTTGLSFRKKKLLNVFPIPEEDFIICADGYVQNMFHLENKSLSIDTPLGMYRIHGSNNWNSDKQKAKIFVDKTVKHLNERNEKIKKCAIPFETNGISFSNYFFDTLELEEGKTYILFGTGLMGKTFYSKMKDRFHVAGFASSAKSLDVYLELPLFDIDELLANVCKFDYIVIASDSMVEIVELLLESGIAESKIKHPKL